MAASELKSKSTNDNNNISSSNSNNSSSSSSIEVNVKSHSGGNSEISVPEPHMPMAPTSPNYPPYGAAAYMDRNPNYDHSSGDPAVNYTTYVYPLSPQFSVQYYPDYSNGYQSYPGSPSLHPQSPPINATSPPFSPSFPYQQGMALSPPTHAYMLPPHSAQPFPPLHISSPVLSGSNSMAGSPPPPQHYLPGPYVIQASTDNVRNGSKKHHQSQQQQQHQHQQHQLHQQQQQQLQEQLEVEANSFHTHNIYVRGLAISTTDQSFLEMCQVYGSIASSKAIIDQKTGECKGYGFAMFNNEQECEKAIEGLNKAGLQASFARVGQESFSSRLRNLQDETSTNIYISNLPLDISEQKLEELFHPYQTISNRILRDPQTGMSRGVGFARLTDREAAAAIIERFNGHVIEGSSAPLQVRFADSPAQKKLKNQTGKRKVIRPREFPPMAAFTMRPMMPITPETMLGIAPSVSTSAPLHHFPQYHHPQYAAHIVPQQRQHEAMARHQKQDNQDGLVQDMEKKMSISDETAASH
ncbi:hypothetical protein [Parasitella parasitica]|uniref:RRM domain-containing protein n=1 Tax=Parasitella parasitica TaxID=35722 RepID=A0A0B7NBR8_9FUNG|nr:hypothetical protein [Parasitella parasitica]